MGIHTLYHACNFQTFSFSVWQIDARLYINTLSDGTTKSLKSKNGYRFTNRAKCPKDAV